MTEPLVLVLGGSGNLGQSLKRFTSNFTDYEFLFPSRAVLSLHRGSQVTRFLEDTKPFAIINAAAWTNVEGAETDQESAKKLNATLPSVLASWCSKESAKFIHFSTDYVFDGLKPDPYLENDPKSPLSVYGSSKSEGEDAIIALDNPTSTIVRTSGLYGFTRNNFVMKVLDRAINGDDLKVVVDQTMTPTNADDLAMYSLSLLKRSHFPRVIHFSNKGSTNWNEVSRFIYQFVGQDPEKVKKISSSEYESRAKRPQQSRLGTLFPDLADQSNHNWTDSLERFLREVLHD
jgi:dTDP-4-dehydrorhamnose reductase